jgi:CBS domain containing-hemolysin-like protein
VNTTLIATTVPAGESGFFDRLSSETLVSLVLFFLLLNGFFVATEFALIGLRKTRVEQMLRSKLWGSRAISRGKDHINDFVAASQIGITFASMILGAAGATLFRGPLSQLGLSNPALLTGLSLIMMTSLHVMFGEQIPKMLAIQFPSRVAQLTAPVTEIFMRLCKPAIRVLSFTTRQIMRLLRVPVSSAHTHEGSVYSEEEIESLLGSREKAGLADRAEGEMISRVFGFFDMVATQVMIPRTEIVGVHVTANLQDLVTLAAGEHHERYPVYGEDLDDTKGVVLIKDLIGAISQRVSLDSPVTQLMREVLSIPGSLSVAALMTEMQRKRTRVAVVLDEFGGTAGMVTYGDLLERIVGEVEETSALESHTDIHQLEDGTYTVSGLVLIKDIEDTFDLTIEDEHNDTIGGAVFSLLGRRPEIGDRVTLAGLEMRVESMDGLRIDRLTVRRLATHGSGESDPPQTAA